MTPDERDELMIEIGLHYVLRSPPSVTTDAIAPIIERLVAERVAAETERCKQAIVTVRTVNAANFAPDRPDFTAYDRAVLDYAAAIETAAIRSATR